MFSFYLIFKYYLENKIKELRQNIKHLFFSDSKNTASGISNADFLLPVAFQKGPRHLEMARGNLRPQNGFARAGSGFRSRDRERIDATTSYPSGKEAGIPLCWRVPPRPQLPPCASIAAARARREDSSSRCRARPGSIRHLQGRKTSRTWRSAPWHTRPVHTARIWHPVPGTAARESPNHDIR